MYNNMRITGLASGIDTEEMIQGMMKAERIKYDRVGQEKQILTWRQEMYNSLNKDYANFILNTRKLFGLTTTTATGAFEPNHYSNLNWVKKATSSDETMATVSSTAKAMNGSYTVNVERLAEGVKAVSYENITANGNGKENLARQFNLDGSDVQFKLHSNGKEVTVKFVYDESAEKVSHSEDGSIITINANKANMNDFSKAINNVKFKDAEGNITGTLGLKATYDSNIDRFFLQTEGTGKDSTLGISEANEAGTSFVESLKLNVTHTIYNDGKFEKRETVKLVAGTEYKGQNALLNFDGAEGIEQSSNQFTINGIDFSLKGKGKFTTTVETDVDAVYEKIEKFVEEYNTLVDKTNKLLTEKKYRNYQPLTSEQKKEMEESDIKLWEEKAKSGLLRSDDIISRTMQNSRTWLYRKVDGVSGDFDMLYKIGIDTEKYARGTTGGKLEINEAKLKDAIRKDSHGVLELLFKEPEYGVGNLEGVNQFQSEKELNSKQIEAKRNQSGLINRLYDNFILGMQDVIEKSGTGNEASLYRSIKSNMLIDFVTNHSSISLIDKDMLSIDKKLDDLGAYLVRKENHYYNQFAAMEKAISRMNQQSMWLTQQFSN